MAKLRLPASTSGKILVFIGGLLVLCICGFFGSAGLVAITGGGKETATPGVEVAAVQETVAPTVEIVASATEAPTATIEPSETPEPTRTVAPTATTEPTRTPRPTRTPKPTRTPRPTPTPLVTAAWEGGEEPTPEPGLAGAPSAPTVPAGATGLSADDQAYVAAVVALAEQMGAALTDLGRQSTAAARDVSLVLTVDWKVDTAVALEAVRRAAVGLQELEAPRRFIPVQVELLEAASHFLTSTQLYTQAVDELNGAKLQAAAASMEDGKAATERATAELLRILGEAK